MERFVSRWWCSFPSMLFNVSVQAKVQKVSESLTVKEPKVVGSKPARCDAWTKSYGDHLSPLCPWAKCLTLSFFWGFFPVLSMLVVPLDTFVSNDKLHFEYTRSLSQAGWKSPQMCWGWAVTVQSLQPIHYGMYELHVETFPCLLKACSGMIVHWKDPEFDVHFQHGT